MPSPKENAQELFDLNQAAELMKDSGQATAIYQDAVVCLRLGYHSASADIFTGRLYPNIAENVLTKDSKMIMIIFTNGYSLQA